MFNKSKLLSQNFICDPKLVAYLLGHSSIVQNDLVLDIGAGKGIITQELLNVRATPVAIEIDKELISKIPKNATVINIDFRNYQLPKTPYKVFANLPFSLTAEIINKLLNSNNPPTESCLIIQKEAAEKFSGNPKETQSSLFLKPLFEFEIIYQFEKTDFSPSPSVECVLLKIKKRDIPLINNYQNYRKFIKFSFNTWKKDLKVGLKNIFTYNQWKRLAHDNHFNIHAKPTDLSFEQWIKVFEFYNCSLHKGKFVIK